MKNTMSSGDVDDFDFDDDDEYEILFSQCGAGHYCDTCGMNFEEVQLEEYESVYSLTVTWGCYNGYTKKFTDRDEALRVAHEVAEELFNNH